MFKRFLKNWGIPIGLLAIKGLTTARTSLDTYAVTGDWLDVILIDGVMLVLWIVAAYAGESREAMALRPFAAGGAWALYVAQLYIGVEATHALVALIVRIAGGLALAYDTWRYISQLFRIRSRTRTPQQSRAAVRATVFNVSYHVSSWVAAPFVFLISLVVALLDYGRDIGVTVTPVQRPALTGGAPQDSRIVDVTPLLDTGDRRAAVRAMLLDAPEMTVTQLAATFGVSRNTIYRDLDKLNMKAGQ